MLRAFLKIRLIEPGAHLQRAQPRVVPPLKLNEMQ